MRKRRTRLWKIIKILIFIGIIVFIYGCYNFEVLKNNQYVISAKSKIKETVSKIDNTTGGNLSSLIENYEEDEEDDTIYEVENSQDRYYYDQLDDNAKIIYAELLNNLDKIKAGEDYIQISSKLSSLSSSDDMSAELMSAFQNAWDAFRNDNVDVFYIDGAKMSLVTKTIKKGNKVSYEFYISKGTNSNYFIDVFDTTEDVEEAIQFVSDSEDEILNNITEKNDYYKIMKVHNWIVENLSYNMEESTNNANIYGALKDKTVVCEGYARLFKSLMDKLEIPCVIVSGEGIDEDTGSSEAHAWNYVYLKGAWYAIDVTWDDPVVIGQGTIDQDLKYKYFLLGSTEFYKTHIEEGQLVDNGIEFVFPTLSSEDYIKEE